MCIVLDNTEAWFILKKYFMLPENTGENEELFLFHEDYEQGASISF